MKVCVFEGCELACKARGLCSAHYAQQLKGKPLTPIRRPVGRQPRGACNVAGCEKTKHARGMCHMHDLRWMTHGDTSVCTTNRYVPLVDRFWMKVQKGPGCWNWTGAVGGGYGQFTDGHKGKTQAAHRFAYELTIGPIPEGKLLDHRCRNTLCVNPAHLRPVTRKQNGEHRGGPPRNSSTGVLGVHFLKKARRYAAKVGHNGKAHRIPGTFADLQEAAEAVKALRLSLYTHNDADRRTA